MQQRSLRPRIGVLQYFVIKIFSQLMLIFCGNVRQKIVVTAEMQNCLKFCGFCAKLPFVPRVFNRMVLYESNTTALDEQLVAFTVLKNPVLRNLDGLSLQQNKFSKSGCHPQETLTPAVRRANFQSLIWSEDDKSYPVIPSLQGYD